MYPDVVGTQRLSSPCAAGQMILVVTIVISVRTLIDFNGPEQLYTVHPHLLSIIVTILKRAGPKPEGSLVAQ